MTDPTRWPRWVYADGDEPDPRLSFANERTFLAWLRTVLALVTAAVALRAFDLPLPERSELAIALLLVAVAGTCTVGAWWRWAVCERAMRRRRPLPGVPAVTVLMAGMLGCVVGVAVSLL